MLINRRIWDVWLRLRGNALVFFIALVSVLMFHLVWHFKNLHQVGWQIIANRGSGAFADLQKPRGGEYVLPVEVQVMLNFLRTANADSFRVSRVIDDNWMIMHRLVEGAYPLRVVDNAHYYLYMEQEPLPWACRPLMSQGGIALAYCP